MIAAFSAAAVVVVLIAGGAWAALGGRGGCPAGTVIDVAAVPDIAPALQDLANHYNADADSCGKVQVTEQGSAAVLNTLTGRSLTPGSVRLDAWVPESSFWLYLAGRHGSHAPTLHPTGISVARSPVVLAAPPVTTHRLAAEHISPSWRLLLGPWARDGGHAAASPTWLSTVVPDPTRNVAGLAAVTAARREMTGGTGKLARMTGFVRGAQENATANQSALISAIGAPGHGSYPIGATSEQAVWTYDEPDPAHPLTALYPKEGTVALDYPYAMTATSPSHRKAVREFGAQIRSAYGRDLMQQLGFRPPNGPAGRYLTQASGVSPTRPPRLKNLADPQLDTALSSWNRLGLTSRMLVLADVSPGMARVVPGTGGKTRLQIGVDAARKGLGLFPDDTDIGLWSFAAHLSGHRDYRTLVPLGPITQVLHGKTRRTRLLAAADAIRPRPGGGSGLYNAVLAAFRHVERTYRDDRIQSVLILTGSKDAGTNGTTLHSLVRAITARFDPRHPVEIIAIGFGDAVDAGALKQITAPTGGAVYTTDDAKNIGTIFLQAISRRVCTPQCPK